MVDVAQFRKNVSALEKGDDAVRRQAIQALKLLEEKEWADAPVETIRTMVESLQHYLPGGDRPAFMHKEIATILGNLGPRAKPAVRPLCDLLLDGVADPIREAASIALGKIGADAKEAVDRLAPLLTGRNNLSIHAVRALSGIGCADHRVRTALVALWASPIQTQNSQVQVALAICKLKIDAIGLMEVLTATLMTSQDPTLRKTAAEALGYCSKNEPEVVPALLASSLSDKNEDVCEVAKAALERLNVTPESAVLICAKHLKSSSIAETALRKSGPLAVPALTKALADSDAGVRVKAARTLACLGELGAPAAAAFKIALRDRDPEVRLAAAKGLWNITKIADDVVPVLIHLLEEKPAADVDFETRRRFLQTVMEALWRIGPPAIAAKSALLEKGKDKNRMIGESARNALKKIAP